MTITLLNHQLALGEASTRLAKGIRMLLRDLNEEESKSYGSRSRIFDLQSLSGEQRLRLATSRQ
jgi:hypothetical protein